MATSSQEEMASIAVILGPRSCLVFLGQSDEWALHPAEPRVDSRSIGSHSPAYLSCNVDLMISHITSCLLRLQQHLSPPVTVLPFEDVL
jgi:hypothetical protein